MKQAYYLPYALLIFTLLLGNPSLTQNVVIAGVPDINQPIPGSIGNPIDNSCAPVSAANILLYWESVINHSNAFGVTANFSGDTVSDYVNFFMDVNNMGSPSRFNGSGTSYPPSNGTYVIDIEPGFFEYTRWDPLNLFGTPPPPLPVAKQGYNWTFTTDTLVGYPFYKNEIDSGRPAVVTFSHWSQILLGLPPLFDPPSGELIDFFDWGTFTDSSFTPNPREDWNNLDGGQSIGHAVTGVGYLDNFDPDGPGPAPLTNWIICHDNWSTTPRNVAIPWQNWVATITSNPGINIPTNIANQDKFNYKFNKFYPNPFYNNSKSELHLLNTSKVTITVYDVSGKEVKKLLDEVLSNGNHTIDWNPDGLNNGIYFIKINIDNDVDIQKLVYTKE